MGVPLEVAEKPRSAVADEIFGTHAARNGVGWWINGVSALAQAQPPRTDARLTVWKSVPALSRRRR